MYKIVKAAHVLSDETRLRMLNLLLQRECCVCEVMQTLDISLTRASRNLSMLYDAGFLKLRRKGLWALYSIDTGNLDEYLLFMLKGVEIGLKGNQVAAQDIERLKEPGRPDFNCCTSSKKAKSPESIQDKS